jgi:hypothetical protein
MVLKGLSVFSFGRQSLSHRSLITVYATPDAHAGSTKNDQAITICALDDLYASKMAAFPLFRNARHAAMFKLSLPHETALPPRRSARQRHFVGCQALSFG